MTLRNLDYWQAHGEPYRLARPLAALQATLRGYGYIVYGYPNDAHLEARPPEDHTPFSATGWPIESPFGTGFAVDVMPHPNHLMPTIAELAEQIIADKSAGMAELLWLKYVNSTDASGACWQDSWKPTHARRSSTDRGHIHLSGRSDLANSTAADNYDPVARLRARKGRTMILVKLADPPGGPVQKTYVADGMTRRWIRNNAQLNALRAASVAGQLPPLANKGVTAVVTDLDAYGRDVDEVRPVSLDAATLADLAARTAALVSVPGVDITPAVLAEALAGLVLTVSPKE